MDGTCAVGSGVSSSPARTAAERAGIGRGAAKRRRTRPGRAARNRILALGAAAVLAGGCLTACATGTAPVSSSSATGFYKGKTITLIVPGSPGKGSAFVATALQQAMESQLGATIDIEYVTGADVVGQDRVWTAQANGLTIGMLTVTSDLNNTFAKNEALDFSLTDAAQTVIGASYSTPGIFVACGNSSVKSFADVLDGGTALKWVDVTTGGMNLSVHLLMAAYPVAHSYLNGYTSATETVGCERGDGNVAGYPVSNFLDSAGTALDAGLTGLLLTGSLPSTSPAVTLNSSMPTLEAFAAQHPPTTAAGKAALSMLETYFNTTAPEFALFAPKGVPQAQMTELSAAMKAAMAEPSVQKQLVAAGIPAGYVDPGGVQSYINTLITNESVAESALKN